jgi:DEAD/DEAH box helicase
MFISTYSMLLSFVLKRSASLKSSVKLSRIPYREPLHHCRYLSLLEHIGVNPIVARPKSQIHFGSPLKQLHCFSSSAAIKDSLLSSADEEAPMVYPTFAEISELHPLLQKNVEKMKLTTMTEIQARTWEEASSGNDVLGRARTGTGKTVAFLLPAIQQLLQSAEKGKIGHFSSIQMLVLSPTRELASQIHTQAMKLTHGSSIINHQVMFGGAKKGGDIMALEYRLPTILVATPGRLKDHFENTNLTVKNHLESARDSPFSSFFGDVKVLVLDETDRYDSQFYSSLVANKIFFLLFLFSLHAMFIDLFAVYWTWDSEKTSSPSFLICQGKRVVKLCFFRQRSPTK